MKKTAINHYPYCREELPDLNFTYQFSTHHQLGYIVYFNNTEYDNWLADFPLLYNNGYAFGFLRINFGSEISSVVDTRVAVTICSIISDYLVLQSPETILLYHCDAADSRQAVRMRLFQRWFDRYNPGTFIKNDLEVLLVNQRGEVPYYLGYITRSDNKLINDFHHEFEQIAQQFIGLSLAK
ncbi:DUF6169 family protein [Paraflavitalea pollutisoli]|uniref:DUF6169 family protein n=1 Tax=Paraflavitalea pollutisoli TaxID=3034143 RepID=UPI0023EDA608|nr:DUF6169 family protein [Paraflavitalea sp. H1-2-19X]